MSPTVKIAATTALFGLAWAGMSLSSAADQNPLAPGLVNQAHAAEKATIIPPPKVDPQEIGTRAVAIFAGGCFWGVEGVFEHTRGVISAASGYHGGTRKKANYRQVSAGYTDHAEAVRVIYDPSKVSYGELMQIFFSVIADPTMLNAQGPDRGRHYRSALVPINAAQAKAARAYLAQLERGKYWSRPIVTRIEQHKAFYPAEDYHQDFMQKNPNQGYVVKWDKPKIANLKRHFPKKYRAKPVS